MGLDEDSDLKRRAACAVSGHEAEGILLRMADGRFSSVIPQKRVLTGLSPIPPRTGGCRGSGQGLATVLEFKTTTAAKESLRDEGDAEADDLGLLRAAAQVFPADRVRAWGLA